MSEQKNITQFRGGNIIKSRISEQTFTRKRTQDDKACCHWFKCVCLGSAFKVLSDFAYHINNCDCRYFELVVEQKRQS